MSTPFGQNRFAGRTQIAPRLGQALAALGRDDGAETAFGKVGELLSSNAEYLNSTAWRLAKSSDPRLQQGRAAVELAKGAVEISPKSGVYWNTLGTAHYRAGQWQEAVEALEKSRMLRNGGDPFDFFFLAMAQYQLGDHEQARDYFDRAVKWTDQNQPGNEELRRFRAEAETLLGKLVGTNPD